MKMPLRPAVCAAWTLAVVSAGCTAPETVQCQRYDALSLSRDNGFAAALDWKDSRTVDLPGERIEVAVSAVRPMKGPVELVHLIGDAVADRWTLNIPDYNNAPISVCTISPAGGPPPNCGAALKNAPFSPLGYYYLRAGDNTVVEAGLAFFLCD